MSAKVIFDTTFLLLLFDAEAKVGTHPDTGKPVDHARERIDGLIKTFERDKIKIGIPTPALSELLVGAGTSLNEYMNTISEASCFKVVSFDEKAAVECALLGSKELKGDGKKDPNATKAKLKFDRQILAIARAENIDTIYSDDDHLAKLSARHSITVKKIHEVDVPDEAKQGKLI
jgi:ribosomal protein L20A (L18A)